MNSKKLLFAIKNTIQYPILLHYSSTDSWGSLLESCRIEFFPAIYDSVI